MEEPEETELIVDPSRKVAVINEHFLREFTEFVCSFTNLFIQTNRNDQNVLSEDVRSSFFLFLLFSDVVVRFWKGKMIK